MTAPRLLLALAVAATSALAVPTAMHAQGDADREGVRRAALDYLEGFYEGDSTKLIRSVRTDVHKYGFSRGGNAPGYQDSRMPWPDFLSFARRVRESGRTAPASVPKEVQLLDVLDQTAAVKVTAWWGTDYLLMAKFDGRWMITQVLWQSRPPSSGATQGAAAAAVTPASVSIAQFQRLRWIAGRWRGSGGNYPSFFEEYAVLDDSTMRRRSFTDSTFNTVSDSARFVLRAGHLAQLRGGRAYPATRFTGDTVRYEPETGGPGSMWVRITDNHWRAILDPRSAGGTPTVYELHRIGRR